MPGKIAARVLARLHVAGLTAGRQKNKDRHQDQQRVAEQPDEPEQEGKALADRGGSARGARVAHLYRQQARAARGRRPSERPG